MDESPPPLQEQVAIAGAVLLEERARTTLYRAKRLPGSDPVIVKVARSDTPHALERMRRECAVAHHVGGPGVVRAHGLTSFRGSPALVLEDSGGTSLDRAVKLPMDVATFLPIAIRIAVALSHVHERGVVHSDVKPSNLIFDPGSGEVKVSDFGSARGGPPEASHARADRAFDVTPAYMAPEQTGRTNRAVDARADLYSLGVTYFELLSGALPFVANDALEWMHAHLARLPPRLAHVVNVPRVLSDIVARLLAKAPEDRYQTAAGLAADLSVCLASFEATGSIAPFALGARDASDQFQVPARLYGRGEELAALERAFARVIRRGAPAPILVSGYSGAGKTSLVGALHGPVLAERGFFVSGKLDAIRRGVPYAGMAQALGDLFRQVLAGDVHTTDAWARGILAAVGSVGRVLTDVVPELELLIGPQPPVTALGAAEAQNRLAMAFHALMSAVARPEHPIVLFLDDMQWTDPGTLRLIQGILESTDLGPLLLVLAYRENEVDAAHPFALAMEAARRSGLDVETIAVLPLTEPVVQEIIADTLRAPREEVLSLSARVFAKTGGNPFFTSEFLRTLHLDGILSFDRAAARWRWSDANVDARGITENVVHLMLDRMRRLPPATQTALRLAACIGGTFDVAQLAVVAERSLTDTYADLAGAIDGGLLAAAPTRAGVLRFQHDRIQQAAYALIEEGRAAEVHLRIARLLRARLADTDPAAHVFDVVDQLDAAIPLITDPEERDDTLRLNLVAATRAKAAAAYAQARRYFDTAASLLPGAAWEVRYDDSFHIHIELAECEYLTGALAEAQARFDDVLAHARSMVERGAVLSRKMNLLQVAGRYDEAAAVAIAAFRMFDLDPPETDAAAPAEMEREATEARALLGDRSIESLLDAPAMKDPIRAMALRLLEAAGPPIYMVRPALFAWLTVKMLRYSLQYGNDASSCYAYGLYGIMLASSGQVDDGHAFAELAIRLNDRLGDSRLRCCVNHLMGDHVHFWKHHIATDIPILDKGFAAGLEGGDLVYSNYIGFQSPWHLWESGAPLEDVLARAEKFASFALQTRHVPVYETLRVEQQFVRAWQGLTDAPGALDGGGFRAEDAFAVIRDAGFGCGVVYFHIVKLVLRFAFGDHAGAMESARLAEADLASAFSMPIQNAYYVFRALTQAALAPAAAPDVRARYLAEMRECHVKLTGWARACPDNFDDKRALVGAEIARVEGRLDAALRLYEEAIEAARRSRFTQYEAIACELASRAYAAAGIGSVASFHLARARSLYRQWGASAKVAELDGAGADAAIRGVDRDPRTTHSTSTATQAAQIDLLSVAKVAQSISGEIALPRLLAALMRVVLEHAGAQRGSLVLVDGDAFVLGAAADVARDERDENVWVPSERVAPSAEALPLSILQFVRRTGERVILEDARQRSAFSSDPYLRLGKLRSALCMPVARKRRLAGLLYLENDLVTGAFNAERLVVLELLAAQTAISIDNASLYKASQDAIAARDEFLSIASHELKTPLTAVQMRVQSLLRGLEGGRGDELSAERVAKLATVADRQMTRLTRLVESLLDVSRIQAGRLRIEPRRTDLAALVREVVDRHAPELAAARCAVRVDATRPVIGCWDAARLDQVVTNLVTNAMKFGKGQPIAISIDADAERARLVVQDCGIGVAAADRARIFERFERIASANNVDGLGLGLWISREIVAAHRGAVRVESAEGREGAAGASFVVELPLDAARVGDGAPPTV